MHRAPPPGCRPALVARAAPVTRGAPDAPPPPPRLPDTLVSAVAAAALTAAALLSPVSPLSPAGSLAREQAATVALFERARPGVVFITALGTGRDSFTLDPTERPQGAGSGVVWDDRGHIVTNAHVVRGEEGERVEGLMCIDRESRSMPPPCRLVSTGADDLRVTLADGADYAARVVGSDPDRDVAVLELGRRVTDDDDGGPAPRPPSSPTGPAPATLAHLSPIPRGASSALRVGQTVFAIGAPFGLDHTLTSGILSGLDREVPSGITGRPIGNMIQHEVRGTEEKKGGFELLAFFSLSQNHPLFSSGVRQPRQQRRRPAGRARQAGGHQHGDLQVGRGGRKLPRRARLTQHASNHQKSPPPPLFLSARAAAASASALPCRPTRSPRPSTS